MAGKQEIEDQSTSNGSRTNGYQNGDSSTVKPSYSTKSLPKAKSSGGSAWSTMRKYRQDSRRPLPTEMGDGSYRPVAKRPTFRQDLGSIGMNDVKTLLAIISAKLKGETQQDDKTMIMERTIGLVAGLPDHSKTQEILTNDFIGQLWNSLDHPPLLYMGDEFKYRRPDAKFNNPIMPHLGSCGQPYSRTVKPHVTGLGALPDPEAIYEGVMARGKFRKNPNNVSSILWYWATIIIHDLFWTNLQDANINESSSYLDLAPLYGGTQEAQNSVRTFKDGMMKPDSIADKRMYGNPPGVIILLLMFNRFHNHVAKNLAAINEHNRFPKPADSLTGDAATAAWKKYDEELFQTARLITSGLYINITLIDYVRNIINLNRVDSTWTLDPRQEMGVSMGTKEGSEAGVGNSVSAEFNLCYRWHSCISEMDDKWIQDFYTDLLGDNYGDMNLQTLMMAFKKFEMSVPAEPSERNFSGLQRGPDGSFDDGELVDLISTAIEQPGGAFGGRNVPRIMKPVEMLGIMRGRKWNLAGLNEFRKHFGLKAYETFEAVNSDPEIAENLRNLYQHPDNIELYPGIVAEEAKSPMVPGVGIAPTYTISRVVLSDAVSLVRGDRYYTTDYHPGNLTNWGYKEASYDFDINHGCVFYKLFLRAFPNHFKQDSVYAHYPMVIPSENHQILTNIKRVDRFNFDRPGRNITTVDASSYGAARHVITKSDIYKVSGQSGLEFLMGGTFDSSTLSDEKRKALQSLLYRDGWKNTVRTFYSTMTEKLFKEKSYKIAGKTQIDIVRDVGNLANMHFVAKLFDLPIKTKENPKGVFSELEMYQALSLIYTACFLDIDPAVSFPLRQHAKEAATKLAEIVEANVKLANSPFGFKSLFTTKNTNDSMSSYGTEMAKGLTKSGLSAYEVAWTQILPAASSFAPNQAQVFAQALDYYLSPAGESSRADLYKLATAESGEDTDALLLGYILEGIRMSGATGVYREATAIDTIPEDDGSTRSVKPGDKIFVSFSSAAMDPAHFPDPTKVNPRRPLSTYIKFEAGAQAYLGSELSKVGLVEMFRVVFRKKGLRKVTGPQGELKRVPGLDGFFHYLTEDWGEFSPFPLSMKVTWDGE